MCVPAVCLLPPMWCVLWGNQVVSGDYVAYVHIIEARELKGEDLQVSGCTWR